MRVCPYSSPRRAEQHHGPGLCKIAACAGSGLGTKLKAALAAVLSLCCHVCILGVPQNAFLTVYSNKYPAAANRLLYCKENANGTTAVFQDVRKTGQKFLLIDGTGEASTDYFSMRAFRFLGMLPALYSPEPKNALIVTFGSGIVAGFVARLPGHGER